MPLFRTLLVDDDDIVREVRGISLARHNRLKMVGSVGTGEAALLAADTLKPNPVILDLCPPGPSGVDTMRAVVKSLPQVGISVLSAVQTPEKVEHAFDTGAAGYVFKPSSGIDLPEAIRAVIAGHQDVPPVLRRNLSGASSLRVQLPWVPCPASEL